MTTLRLLEIRHAECESLGTYAGGLPHDAEVTTLRAERDTFPDDPASFDAIAVMGGGMGANDGPTYPWIDDEIDFLRRALSKDVPIWGVCLGSQLLASAADAKVSTGPAPEIGISKVTWTPDGVVDPVWKDLSDKTFDCMQWHYDTFELPEGATLLASSEAYPNQAFRLGASYGLQFHLEVDSPLFATWLDDPDYRTELVDALGPSGPDQVSADLADVESTTRAMAAAAMSRWFDVVVARQTR